MPLNTFWESICTLAGENGQAPVRFEEAVNKSAVPEKVAAVEMRRMVDDGLLESDGDYVRLTERGRKSCSDVNTTTKDNLTVAPE